MGWRDPANIRLFKVNGRNTRKRCEICSKLTIKTVERCSGVFIVDFENIAIVNYKQISVCWAILSCVNITTQSIKICSSLACFI